MASITGAVPGAGAGVSAGAGAGAGAGGGGAYDNTHSLVSGIEPTMSADQ